MLNDVIRVHLGKRLFLSENAAQRWLSEMATESPHADKGQPTDRPIATLSGDDQSIHRISNAGSLVPV